jgi:hypothetical protein
MATRYGDQPQHRGCGPRRCLHSRAPVEVLRGSRGRLERRTATAPHRCPDSVAAQHFTLRVCSFRPRTLCAVGSSRVGRRCPVSRDWRDTAASVMERSGARHTMPGKFEITKDKRGEYRFRLKSTNGQTVAVSRDTRQKRTRTRESSRQETRRRRGSGRPQRRLTWWKRCRCWATCSKNLTGEPPNAPLWGRLVSLSASEPD